MTIRFSEPHYEGGRIILMCGAVDAGAVFPSSSGTCRWRLWFGHPLHALEGTARSELAGRNAILAALCDVLARAGLQPIPTEEPPCPACPT